MLSLGHTRRARVCDATRRTRREIVVVVCNSIGCLCETHTNEICNENEVLRENRDFQAYATKIGHNLEKAIANNVGFEEVALKDVDVDLDNVACDEDVNIENLAHEQHAIYLEGDQALSICYMNLSMISKFQQDLEDREDEDEEEKDNENREGHAGPSGHLGPDDDDDQDQPGTGPSTGGTGTAHSQPPASRSEHLPPTPKESEPEHRDATGTIVEDQLQLSAKVLTYKKRRTVMSHSAKGKEMATSLTDGSLTEVNPWVNKDFKLAKKIQLKEFLRGADDMFSGMERICMMYAGVKQMNPSIVDKWGMTGTKEKVDVEPKEAPPTLNKPNLKLKRINDMTIVNSDNTFMGLYKYDDGEHTLFYKCEEPLLNELTDQKKLYVFSYLKNEKIESIMADKYSRIYVNVNQRELEGYTYYGRPLPSYCFTPTKRKPPIKPIKSMGYPIFFYVRPMGSLGSRVPLTTQMGSGTYFVNSHAIEPMAYGERSVDKRSSRRVPVELHNRGVDQRRDMSREPEKMRMMADTRRMRPSQCKSIAIDGQDEEITRLSIVPTNTDKEDNSKGFDEESPKGSQAKGPSEFEKSDEEDTSTPLDRKGTEKSKKLRSETQIVYAEAQARVEERKKKLADARATKKIAFTSNPELKRPRSCKLKGKELQLSKKLRRWTSLHKPPKIPKKKKLWTSPAT
ncbi:hypothetical protein L7F22_013092 [Adiantum nelumboides]|nr:hypothetical protein [Adiantum nelumboides]